MTQVQSRSFFARVIPNFPQTLVPRIIRPVAPPAAPPMQQVVSPTVSVARKALVPSGYVAGEVRLAVRPVKPEVAPRNVDVVHTKDIDTRRVSKILVNLQSGLQLPTTMSAKRWYSFAGTNADVTFRDKRSNGGEFVSNHNGHKKPSRFVRRGLA